MVINTNTSAQVSANNLQASSTALSRSLARLSSGSKIVNPSDDAAGLAVAARLDATVKRLGAANNNVGNAISFTQTQDGYLKKISKALDRMSELSITTAAGKDFNGVPLFSTSNIDVTQDSDGNAFSMNGISLTTAGGPYATAI